MFRKAKTFVIEIFIDLSDDSKCVRGYSAIKRCGEKEVRRDSLLRPCRLGVMSCDLTAAGRMPHRSEVAALPWVVEFNFPLQKKKRNPSGRPEWAFNRCERGQTLVDLSAAR